MYFLHEVSIWVRRKSDRKKSNRKSHQMNDSRSRGDHNPHPLSTIGARGNLIDYILGARLQHAGQLLPVKS